jgi:hypothetical protein
MRARRFDPSGYLQRFEEGARLQSRGVGVRSAGCGSPGDVSEQLRAAEMVFRVSCLGGQFMSSWL